MDIKFVLDNVGYILNILGIYFRYILGINGVSVGIRPILIRYIGYLKYTQNTHLGIYPHDTKEISNGPKTFLKNIFEKNTFEMIKI